MNCNLSNNNITFGAGVTQLIRKEIVSANPCEIERVIKRNFGTECDFENNRTLASCTLYALRLLEEAFKKFDLPFNVFPPKIKVFKPNEIVKQENIKFGFCIINSEKIMRKEPEYPSRSIFIKNRPDNLTTWDRQVDEWYREHITSSDNFLAPFLHELIHNIHINLIFKKSPQYANRNLILLQNTPFDYSQNRIISEKIGTYARTSKIELFPEALAKMIADSVDNSGIKLASNPLDRLSDFPKFVREFIESQIN